jgi:NAD(P)-dependent dehydrogenase (short-subunit alcohol dehydrogenase family)
VSVFLFEARVARQVAIITGGGGAIGRATALELAALGFDVVLVGRTESSLNDSARTLKGALVIVADVTKLDDIDRIAQTALSKYGRVDVLVNNAGAAPAVSIEQITPQIWREIVDTNLSAPLFLSRAVWPAMKTQGRGTIVNISSLAARDPFEGLGPYGAAKAGLNLLGLSLAREGKAFGIRVHTIAPGAVETPMLRKLVGTDVLPTGQTMSPKDVARVIVQCVSGDLKHTSGEVIWLHK